MLDDTADVVQRGFRKATIEITGEEILSIFHQRLMDMHPTAVIANERLWHKGCGLAKGVCDVLHDVLQDQYFVSLLHQGTELHADFTLTCGRDFVVMDFDNQTHVFKGVTHSTTEILERVDRRHREIPPLGAWTMAHVTVFIDLLRVPTGLFRVDLVEGPLHAGAPADIVKNKEFVFRSKKCAIGDTR